MRLLALVLLLTGCATATAPAWTLLGSSPYTIGPLTVHVLTSPRASCKLLGAVEPPNRHIRGCYDPVTRTIYTEPDWAILLHELKHYFEGNFHP